MKFPGNYTLNIFNNLTVNELPFDTFCLSPELNKNDLQNFSDLSKVELIVYGKIPVMNSNYCLFGHTNKCYQTCEHLCTNFNKKYYLKDRLGLQFRILPDNIDTVTTIYNSKITSIEHKDVNVNSVRIDILDEDVDEINNIIKIVSSGQKLEGKNFTNGNFHKDV